MAVNAYVIVTIRNAMVELNDLRTIENVINRFSLVKNLESFLFHLMVRAAFDS